MTLKDLFVKKPKEKAIGNFGSMTWQFVNGQFVIDEDRSTTYIDKGYKSLPNLYGIISLITSKSSIVPHETFRVTNEAKFRKYKAQMKSATTTRDYAKAMVTKAQAMEKVEGTELDALLTKPNLYQSIEDFYESVDGYLLLTGNSYMYGMTTGLRNAVPKELHSLISPSVTIKVGASWREPVQGYTLSYMGEPIPAEEVGHLKYWNPISSYSRGEDLLYGLSPLKSCRRLLGKYVEADIAQGSMFKNMGVSGILAKADDAHWTEEQARMIQDKWQQLYGGSAKAGQIAVTSANVRWQQIGLSPVDLNIIQGKEEILGELCNVYHVPIGMFTKVNSTENNMIESRKMFITDAIIPLVERRKNVINRWLAPKFGENLVVEYDYTIFYEMQEDMEKQAKIANDSREVLTIDERRALLGYDMLTTEERKNVITSMGLQSLSDMDGDIEMIDEQLLDETDTGADQ